MALTASNMLTLGTVAPDFTLRDSLSGESLSLQQLKGRLGTLILFICNHCPYVRHIEQGITELAQDYINRDIAIIAINANDPVAYPEDAPVKMQLKAKQLGWKFPYLFDETQSVARAYQAACTPDIFLFDSHLACVYRGQFDDSRPGNTIAVTGQHLRSALEALIAGEPISVAQIPSIGCNIKWRNHS